MGDHPRGRRRGHGGAPEPRNARAGVGRDDVRGGAERVVGCDRAHCHAAVRTTAMQLQGQLVIVADNVYQSVSEKACYVHDDAVTSINRIGTQHTRSPKYGLWFFLW